MLFNVLVNFSAFKNVKKFCVEHYSYIFLKMVCLSTEFSIVDTRWSILTWNVLIAVLRTIQSGE